MKFFFLITLLATVACSKSPSSKSPVVQVNKEHLDAPKTSTILTGRLCQLRNRTENKPIFLTMTENGNGLTVKMFEAMSQLTEHFVNFDGHIFHLFEVKRELGWNGTKFAGEAIIIHDDVKSLSNTANIIGLKLKLLLKDNGEGEIHRSLKVQKSESVENTRYQRFAEISNCELAHAQLTEAQVAAK